MSDVSPAGPTRRLTDLSKAHILLESETKEESWTNLYKKVQPWQTGIELSDNIRSVVREYIAVKIPDLKNRVPALAGLDYTSIVDALVNNWFEEVSVVEGTRDEVLLTVMAHVVKRIETYAYKEVLKNANDEDLEYLGLNPNLRDLTVSLLDTAIKVDPLFIRFKTMNFKVRKPRKTAAILLPDSKIPNTFTALFPKESLLLAGRFEKLATKKAPWQKENGGKPFKEYLLELGKLYAEQDPQKAAEQQKKVEMLYDQLLQTDFPIILTPSTTGYIKEPYLDPELKVSLATRDSQEENVKFDLARQAMADSLNVINAEGFQDAIRNTKARGVIAIGSYGVNLTFSAVAQESPQILLYLNEQLRAYDRDFPRYIETIGNSEKEFKNLLIGERQKRMEFMCRMNSILHEYSHSIHPVGPKEIERLGEESLVTIDEMKADSMYRALIPSILDKGGLEGTREQWAIALLASALQEIHDQPKNDPYFSAGVYSLNTLFAEEVVVQRENQFAITDYGKYYDILKRNALELKVLYEKQDTVPEEGKEWLKTHAVPGEQLKKGIALIKSLIKE